MTPDTIVAVATPPGRGAIAIVRCSGPHARTIVAAVARWRGTLADRIATAATVRDRSGAVIDRGIVLAMDGPRSATGEDVVELHLHGSPIVVRETLLALLAAGARLARAGEFTRRGYENGKLALHEAEAVADLIAAESRAAALAAAANLSGGLAGAIAAVRTAIGTVLEELAASIDFPDEVPAPERAGFAERVAAADAAIAVLLRDAEHGRLVREGVSLAIVGPPNAGKSSLFNALLAEERAIVTPVPGTTRDTIEELFVVDGVPVRAIDTAGLRQTSDTVEQIGITRSESALAAAAVALVVVDGSVEIDADTVRLLERTRDRPRIVFFNKADRGAVGYTMRHAPERDAIHGSVFDPAALARIRAAIADVAWGSAEIDAARPHLSLARHADAAQRCRDALGFALDTLARGMPLDLIVPDLIEAVAALDEMTTDAASNELLDRIFARFCIGK